MGMKHKKFKMADSKKLSYSTNSQYFLRKFQGLVLGLVEYMVAKNINVAQPILSSACPTYAQKMAKNTRNAFFVFLAIFWAYVRQPDNHWDTSMPFASINSTNPRTNPWYFREKILGIGGVENTVFLFFSQKNIFFALSPWKSVKVSRLARMGRNFDDYTGFQPKTTAA